MRIFLVFRRILRRYMCWVRNLILRCLYSTKLRRVLSPSYNCPNPNQEGVTSSVLTTANQRKFALLGQKEILFRDKLDSRKKVDQPGNLAQSQNFGGRTLQDATSWCFKTLLTCKTSPSVVHRDCARNWKTEWQVHLLGDIWLPGVFGRKTRVAKKRIFVIMMLDEGSAATYRLRCSETLLLSQFKHPDDLSRCCVRAACLVRNEFL